MRICDDIGISWTNDFRLLGINFSNLLSRMIKLNYDDKLIEIESLMNAYSKRGLSLIG